MDQEPEDQIEPPEEPLPPVRRSFPVPIRRAAPEVEYEEAGGAGVWSGWTVKVAIFAAGALAGIAVWSKLRPQESREVAQVAAPAGEVKHFPPAPPPPGPPDAARDIYMVAPPPPGELPEEEPGLLPPPAEYPPVVAEGAPLPPMVGEGPPPGEPPPPDGREGDGVFDMLNAPPPDSPVAAVDTPADTPAPEIPADTPPETPPQPLGPLEEKYLAALERSAGSAAEAERAPWQAEMERVRKGQPLPATSGGLPEPLARLQAIYRREKERGPAPVVSPDARTLSFYVYANADVIFRVNGQPMGWKTSNLGVSQVSVDLKPGDVVGFELPSNRQLAVIARAGVRAMFSTSNKWEAATDPQADFWTGGPIAKRAPVAQEQSGFKKRMAHYEQVAKAHSSDYAVVMGQGGGNTGFRYLIRKVDLPERK